MSFRKEKKFRVTVSDFHKFQDQLSEQGMETLFEPRLITSVYFDTANLNMFNDSEEGLLPRKKVRIRWYNNSKAFSLENKTSSVEGRFKLATKLGKSISENELLTRNRMDAQYGLIQPTLKVSYKRSYFMYNEMRLTFDKDICYTNFKSADRRKFYDPERVIEIKISANCADDFVETLIPFPTARFSKYSRGILFSTGGLSEN